LPQSTVPPQPSGAIPHVAPIALHATAAVAGTQAAMPPHLKWVPPPPQVSGAVQVPQLRVPPQPSPISPQLALTMAQVRGVHVPAPDPHLNGVPPPPQVSGAVQLPQLTVPPQPSDAMPHVAL
jgi:hypothetical protein